MADKALNEMTATEIVAAVAAGSLSVEAVTIACLERIEAREPDVQAWVHLDPEQALAQARALDRAKAQGAAGPLHGVPIALKDIFDTADMPTECGSRRYAGRRPAYDAFAVQLLRQAGAVILGKAVTTEIALLTPGKTRNPHDPARTPGGSSSGSAAAVGDRMVPLALGSQTSGSTLRPASYCGIHGYKPTFGSISCTGVGKLSRTLDHVGPLARSLEDLALLGDVLMVPDPRDGEMRPDPALRLREALARPLEASPRVGFARTPWWDLGDPATFRTFEDTMKGLAPAVEEIELPGSFATLFEHHGNVMGAGLSYFYAEEVTRDPPLMQPDTLQRIRNGMKVTAGAYLRSLDAARGVEAELDELLRRFDVLVVPPATGEAPVGLGATGNPIFQAPWTLLGMPALCLPLLKGPAGMPMGVQLIARKGDDGHLFRVARWLENAIGGNR